MAAQKKKAKKGDVRVIPHLVISGAVDAIEFYEKAFDAKVKMKMDGPHGGVMHAELEIGGSQVYICDEFPEMGVLSPKSLGGTPVAIHLYVEDAKAWFARAQELGATVLMPLEDTFWGDRYGKVLDPFGHVWSIAQQIKKMTKKEIAEEASRFFSGHSG